MVYTYGTSEQNSKTSLLANFQIAVKTLGKIQCNGLMFFFIMIHERLHERHFASESVTWLDRSDIKWYLSKWRHRVNHKNTAGKQQRYDNPLIKELRVDFCRFIKGLNGITDTHIPSWNDQNQLSILIINCRI